MTQSIPPKKSSMKDISNEANDISRFFYFSLLDEKTVKKASVRVLRRVLRTKGTERSKGSTAADIIFWTNWYLKKLKSKAESANTFASDIWKIPNHINFGAWQEFKKRSNPEEYFIIIWSRLLGYSDNDIADGLGITLGSVSHRMGRGMRSLGQIVRLETLHA